MLFSAVLGASASEHAAASALQPDAAASGSFGGLKQHLVPAMQSVRYETMEPGPRPLASLFTEEGMEGASTSTGCHTEDWRSRMSAVHSLVAHTYILTLPRKPKVEAAMDAAERLLSVGWPKEKTSLFIGADCKALWGQPLVDLAHKWHGKQPIDGDLRAAAAHFGVHDTDSKSIFATSNAEYSKCDLTKPVGQVDKHCMSTCCALSHQLVMLHAFHYGAHALDERILILEEDAAFGPAAFALSTERMLRGLAKQPNDSWHMLKLGECETFSDDERAIVAPQGKCALPTSDASHNVHYQAITKFSTYSSVANHMDERGMGYTESYDPRTKRSYCSHSYMIHGAQAVRLVGGHFPIRSNCDDQMNDSCEASAEATCLRADKYVFNQDPTSGSSLASSCHPCNGEEQFNVTTMGKIELETFNEPRPFVTQLLTGARTIDGEGVNGAGDTTGVTLAATAQPQAVNNMCGQYAALGAGKSLDHLKCHEATTESECAATCKHDKWCTSYIHHPILPPQTDLSTYPTSQYFLCQQDPYTDLSEKMVIKEWQGKCCLRTDDKFLPFIPPVWFYYNPELPHVTSGTTMGDHALDAATKAPLPDAGLRVHMSNDIPDYLAAPAADEVDSQPLSAAATRHANAVEYRQYGTVWAVARKQCQRKGMDLCPPTSYCKNGKQTRMTKSMSKNDWYQPYQAASANMGNNAMWMPTLRSCNSWINLHTCEEPDGASPGSAPYMDALRFPNMQLGCCHASEEATESSTAEELRADHARRAFLSRPANRNWILNSLDDDAVRAQMTKRGKPAVLRIVVNHATSGLFASFQWVMLAMRFAKAAGLRAYVDHGPCTLCGYAPFTQDYSYHDWTAGPNSWSYFWEPVDTLGDLMAKPANQSVDVLTLDTHQIWTIFGTKPRFDIQSFQKGDFSGLGQWGPTQGVGGYVKFDTAWWAKQRSRAWQLVGSPGSSKPIRFSQGFAAYEQKKWDTLLAKSAAPGNGTAAAAAAGGGSGAAERPKLIAAHMRGTDKQCGIGGPKIPAKDHFAMIDAFLAKHPGSLVFVATDAPSTARAMRARYGDRLLLEDAVRSEKNALHEHGFHGEGYAFGKAAGAMLDSAHLARADFLLCANSALGESAVWLNPKLAENMFNLQFPLQEQRKPHHDEIFGGSNKLDQIVGGYSPGFC